MRAFVLATLAVLGLAAAPVAPVFAQQETASGAPIAVSVNMARVLRLSGPASTVIIGNPGVADVTIQDPQTLILTGRSYGQTNLIVLDSTGAPVADTIVEVVQRQAAGSVTIYQGLSRQTLACAPTCQPTVMLGDAPSFTGEAVSSAQIIAGQAASR